MKKSKKVLIESMVSNILENSSDMVSLKTLAVLSSPTTKLYDSCYDEYDKVIKFDFVRGSTKTLNESILFQIEDSYNSQTQTITEQFKANIHTTIPYMLNINKSTVNRYIEFVYEHSEHISKIVSTDSVCVVYLN